MKRLLVYYVITNSIGLFLYFIFDSRISNFARLEQRSYFDASDSFTYLSTAFPVLLSCLLINILWGIKASIDIVRHKKYHAAVALIVATALWVTVFGVCRYLENSAIHSGTLN
jgi:hypothetical protein